MTRVVKIGGAAMGDPGWLAGFASAVAAVRGPLVIVHGGGREIDALSERLGVEVAWNGGRRVTSAEAFEVASMVLTGRLNKRIVSALVDVGVDALGLSGEDAGLVTAGLVAGGALGRVGVVERVRTDLLDWVTSRGLVPVISPISRGPHGSGLNVNADEVATAVAAALGAEELLYLTDVPGVSDASGVRARIDAAEADALIRTGAAGGGMALKLRAALSALDAGVASVRIGRPDMVLDAAAGTRMHRRAAAPAVGAPAGSCSPERGEVGRGAPGIDPHPSPLAEGVRSVIGTVLHPSLVAGHRRAPL